MNTLSRIIASMLMACIALPAAAAAQYCLLDCKAHSVWADFNSFQVVALKPDTPIRVTYHGTFDPVSGDLLLEVKQIDHGVTRQGSIMFIGGRMIAAKGDVFSTESALDALDDGIQLQQLVVRILTDMYPAGAGDMTGPTVIEHIEKTAPIQLSSPGAEGYFFGIPWRAEGDMRPEQAGTFQYRFDFQYPGPRGPSGSKTMQLAGVLETNPDPRIADDTPLAGWSVVRIGTHVTTSARDAKSDDGSTPSAPTYNTVADMRSELSKGESQH